MLRSRAVDALRGLKPAARHSSLPISRRADDGVGQPSNVSRRDTARIAQRFIAGYAKRPKEPSPVGTTEGLDRPYWTWVSVPPTFPALKRWATIKRPSGTHPEDAGDPRARRGESLAILSIALMSGVAGCSQARTGFLTPANQSIVWPPPPAEPRVRYLGEIGGTLHAAAPRGFGSSLNAFFYGPTEPPHLVTPHAVAMNDDGRRLAVADPMIGCVHVLDLGSSLYRRVEPLTGLDAVLKCPVGVAWAGEVLYIVDAVAHTVYAVGDEVTPARSFGTDELIRPAGIAFNPTNRRLYVTDSGAHALAVFELDGTFVTGIGSRGSATGLLNFPSQAACAPDGTVAVADSMNFRVQRFGPEGEPLGGFGRKGDAAGDFALPKGVAVDSNGFLWVVDAQFENVQTFAPDGRLALTIGAEGHGPGQFWLPAGIAIDRQRRMWIADTYNRRVQAFELLP